jgi:hypothetical protein
MSDSQEDLILLVASMQADGISIRGKRDTRFGRIFWRTLHGLIWLVTLGRARNLDRYTTTIGPWIRTGCEMADYTDVERISLLTHERVHVGQFRRAGLGSAIVGILPMAIGYLLLPLPIGLAWCRYRLELSAYCSGAEALAGYATPTKAQAIALHPDHVKATARYASLARSAEVIADRLSGPDYAWAWYSRSHVLRQARERLGLNPDQR